MTGFVKRFLGNRKREASGQENPSQEADGPKYWLNLDPGGVKLHKESCRFVAWAAEPKWKRFDTENDAYASTARNVRKCRACW